MKIKKIDSYLDGGTTFIVTDNDIYVIDKRIDTKTNGMIYNGYPNKDNSNIMKDQDTIKLLLAKTISNSDNIEPLTKERLLEYLNQ